MLALPNSSAAFRVTCNDRGDVAVGGVGELGLVATSDNDELSYRSLVRELPPNARDFGDVHAIAPAGEHGFVFVTDRFVIFWTGNEARVIADARQRGAYTIGGTVYLAGANGLEKIDPTMTHIVPVALPGREVDLVIDGGDGRVIVVTRNDGLYALASAGIVPFAPATPAAVGFATGASSSARVRTGCSSSTRTAIPISSSTPRRDCPTTSSPARSPIAKARSGCRCTAQSHASTSHRR